MAGDLVTVTQLQNMLKDYYMKTDQDAPMDVYVKMFDEIYKNTKDVDGIAVKAIAKVRRNLGIVTTAFSNSDEPTAGNRGYERATVQPKFIKAKGLFDQQLVLMSKTDTGAFVKELAAVTEDLDESVKLNLARQIFNDGSSKLATLTANVTAASPATVYVHSTQYLEVGMPICIYNAAGTFIEATTIITVDPESNSFTANISNNLQSLYALYYGESSSINAKDNEITGLGAALRGDNSYFGISRTTFPLWRAATVGVQTRPNIVSEVDGSKVVNSLMKRSRAKGENGMTKSYDFIMTDFEAYTAYWAGLVAQRRYNDNVNYKTGVTGLQFDDTQIERDAYALKECAAVARITTYTAGTPSTIDCNTTTGLKAGDKVEIYRGNTLVAHGVGVAITDADTFTATVTVITGYTPAAGDLVYIDNADAVAPAATSPGTAPLVFHNWYYINKDTWQWYVWQDITNYTEQLIGLEFIKVAGKTQYEFTLTGLMELFCETPTKNGRYRFTIDPSYDANVNM